MSDFSVEDTRKMVSAWKSGMSKFDFTIKYLDGKEHAYRVFNKACKERGLVRRNKTAGGIMASLEKLWLEDNMPVTEVDRSPLSPLWSSSDAEEELPPSPTMDDLIRGRDACIEEHERERMRSRRTKRVTDRRGYQS
jgi:hypothetical protein